jgi:hypothetical protein
MLGALRVAITLHSEDALVLINVAWGEL